MIASNAVGTIPEATNSTGPFAVYFAGGLFTQGELVTNILIKEAVWRLSSGKFQFHLPQSRELQVLDRPDVDAHIKNVDLMEVMKADILLARFDGTDLDSGTVVEFVMAKSLGKPAVILRSDFRGLNGTGRTDPYNLMLKNWPRTVDVHLDSFAIWASLFTEERQTLTNSDPFQAMMKAELNTVQKGVDEIAKQVIAGMEAVLEMESPYPPEYQEEVYQASRFSPGCGFDQLLTMNELSEIMQRLRKNGTL